MACLFATPAIGQLPQTTPPPPSAGQLTPRSIAPTDTAKAPSITLEPGPPQTPAGAETLAITPGSITLDGATQEQRALVADILGEVGGKRVSVADLYAVAARIERRFAAHGYPLIRVVIPPQRLVDGGAVRMVLVDGFVEGVDLSNVPHRLVGPLRRVLGPLVGRRNLTIGVLERRLMLAEDVAGATIRSTLAPGKTAGGTQLIIQASQRLVSGSLTFDNRQSPAFRGRNTTLQLSLASPFGFGEQVYGYVSADPWHDIGGVFGRSAPRRTYGLGIIAPLGDNGATLNTEYTTSITQPLGGFFASRDTFRRMSIRVSHPLVRSRRTNLTIGPALDFESERNFLPDFGVALSRDRYVVMRLNANLGVNAGPTFYAGSTTISYGLPGRRGPDDFPSRAGGVGRFVKIEARASITSRLPMDFVLSTAASAQKLITGGIPAAELFSIDGGDGISSVLSGTLASDEGYVARSEIRRAFREGPLLFQPYAYGAFGHLHARVPTPFDIGPACGYGAGALFGVTVPGTMIAPFTTVDVGQARASGALAYRFDRRVFVTAGVRF